MFFKFIYCFIYVLQVHLLLYLCSLSLFIALSLSSALRFKIHLLLYIFALNSFITFCNALNTFIAFIYIYYVLVNIIL